jgi:hypothetical protein
LALSRHVKSLQAYGLVLARTEEMQRKIWSEAVSASREAQSMAPTTLLLPSLNSMIEITSARVAAAETHLPWLVRAMLVILPLICCVLAGLDSSHAGRSWVHILGFAVMLSLTVFVILDLEYPRAGLIRLEGFDKGLLELRNSMQAAP